MRNEQMDEFVGQVRAGSDIVAVVSSYVQLKKRGGRYWGCCPFHQEKTPSFSVVPEQGFFYCFGCHAGGNVFKFLSLIENISYFEAVKMQAEKLNISLPSREKTPAEIVRDEKREALCRISRMACDFFHNCLTMTHYGEAARKYFQRRGITAEIIENFQLGYAPAAWDKLLQAFQKRDISIDFLLESGLVATRNEGKSYYDRFRNRVIIPIADERGHVVGFGGRVLDNSQPKYLNSPETMIFNKRNLLFGLDKSHRAIQQAGFAIIVEGYMDAIAVYSAGIKNVVASLGTAFTPAQGKKLLHYAAGLYFCYDSDEAGQSATLRAMSVVQSLGAAVKVISIPDGKDPDEFIRRHGAQEFQKIVSDARPLAEYRMRYVLSHTDYSSLEGKVAALNGLLPVLESLSNAVERNAYIVRIAQVLGIDEAAVRSEMRRYRPGRAEGVSEPLRHAVRRADDALRQAGRTVIRMVWQDSAVLAHLQAAVPIEEFPKYQSEVLSFITSRLREGLLLDDLAAQEALSEEAFVELSHSLADGQDDQDSMLVYEDCIRILRKDYLTRLYEKHRLLADEMQRQNDAGYLQELAESQRIKNEMDEL